MRIPMLSKLTRPGRRGVPLAVVLASAVLACWSSAAFAETGCSTCRPWWHVNTVYAPAQKNGSEGTLDIEVSNLGDGPTDGTWSEHLAEALNDETKGFITIVEKLPAGLTTTGVKAERPVQAESSPEAPGSFEEEMMQVELEGAEKAGQKVAKLCSMSGQTVTCLYGTPVRPYERAIIAINVKAIPGASTGVNEVSVSGGGAQPVVSRRGLSPDQTPSSYGVENYELTPEEEGGAPDTQAGSHPFQLTTTFAIDTQTVQAFRDKEGSRNNPAHEGQGAVVPEVQPLALTKDLRFDIPPGLIGNPEPLPKCSLLVFTTENKPGEPQCPADTVVGVSTPIITNIRGTKDTPYVFSEPLYSLEPAAGEPARFGFQTPAGPVILDTSVRTGGDYGVVVTVPNIVDYPFMGNQLTFWGVPADARHDNVRGKECLENIDAREYGDPELSCPVNEKPQPFLIMPTACTGPLQTTMQADSWAEPGVFSAPAEYVFQTGAGGIGEPYGMDGCNRLSFEPSVSVAPDGSQGSTPTGLTVDEHVPQQAGLDATGLADSTVRDTLVALPAGVAIDPSGGDGLSACGLGEVALESAAEQTCPESSKVGTVEVHTPLLPNPLVGAAYLAQQEANPFGSLVAMYIVVYDPVSGVRIKVAGEVRPDPVTGQLVATFNNTPELPFEDLVLHFFGGSRAPLGTPALCGSYTTAASIAPWSGSAPVASSSEFRITSGPNGSSCADQLPFDPSLTAGSSNLQAGAFTPFAMTMSREDGHQTLKSIQLKMPPGLSGTLSSVALCGEPQADTGTCGRQSLIGETTVSVGLGGNPFTVTGGKVYITGPYEGAPFGLSIVNPAKAGPFDLESTKTHRPACDCLVVRAKIEVDPHTAALTITSDSSGAYAIPAIIEGIPLQIKHVNVTINGVGGNNKFTFNPTSCSPMAIGGSLQSTEGSTQALSVPFQVTNCATLKFQPKFAVTTAGKTSKAGGAGLAVKLTYPNVPQGTEANIHEVKVDLPKQLPSRLTTLQKACTNAQFEANPAGCPAASVVGHAKAITPLLPVPLEGPAYFVSHGGEAFPSLIVVLQGYGVTLDLVGTTFISKAGITSSTFKTVPDAPVGSFELTLPEGKYSALAANGNLCKSKLAMPTEFVAQNGAEIHESTKITVSGCPKAKKQKKPKKHKAKGKGKKRK
jgi:hypothetical protein